MLSLVIQGDYKRVSENNFHVLNTAYFVEINAFLKSDRGFQ